MSIDLSKLSVTELHEIYSDLVTTIDARGRSQTHLDYFYGIYEDVYEAFYRAKAKTPSECLMKIMALEDGLIAENTTVGPHVISEAKSMLTKQFTEIRA